MGRNDTLWKPDFSSSQIWRGRGATTTAGTASARTAGKATVTVEEFGIPPWICFGRRSPQCLPRKLWKASQRLEVPGRAGYRGKINRKWEWYLKARELGYSPNTCAYIYIWVNMEWCSVRVTIPKLSYFRRVNYSRFSRDHHKGQWESWFPHCRLYPHVFNGENNKLVRTWEVTPFLGQT